MTIGQRIAQQRKELALSQEALGEQLGVSRQAIYKWESDAALPEIDKLIALAKLFGVSVGWLLGVEEAPEAAQPEETEAPPPPDELSETQLRMVQEIVEQYLAAQPKPRPRRRWPFVLAAVVLFFSIFNLFEELDMLRMQQESIHNNISRVEDSVDHQIDDISDRIETILKSQNELTAEYDTEVWETDLAANTITFVARAVPKTFAEGMQAVFTVDNGVDIITTEGLLHNSRAFGANLTCELTDDITLSVTFIYPDTTQQTQLLDTYEGLHWASMPYADVHDHEMIFSEVPDGTLRIPVHYATVIPQRPDKAPDGTEAAITDIQVGLFKNKSLLLWAEPMNGAPANGYAYGTEVLFKFPEATVQLRELDRLHVAALLTDQYGRQTVAQDIPYVIDPENGQLTWADGTWLDRDPANWDFTLP